MFLAHHGASGFGSYQDLIYGLLVMPPALGMAKLYGG
jgi:hypothetical protein